MKLKQLTLSLFLTAMSGMGAFAQSANDSLHTRPITLEETIRLARTRSVDAAVALNELKTS
jgi:hypothetical protein